MNSIPESSPMTVKQTSYKKFDYLIYIGRFQPFHLGHQRVAEIGLSISKELIILCGSSGGPRTTNDPFTFEERYDYITKSLHLYKDRVIIHGLLDYTYNNEKWIQQVQNIVDIITYTNFSDKRIGIIGHHKDNASWYLDIFPQWEFIEVDDFKHPNMMNGTVVSGSDLRQDFYAGWSLPNRGTTVSIEMDKWLRTFREEKWEIRDSLEKEHRFLKLYKSKWSDLDYPVQFITTDTVVTQCGHILLIKRGSHPGKGLWALPGGFLDVNQTSRQSAVRELKEETKLKVPLSILENSVRTQNPVVFDAPARSLRGRTVTHAFYIPLNPDPNTKLSDIRGSDDAAEAKWVPFREFSLMRDQLFEDHFFIAEYFLNLTEFSEIKYIIDKSGK